MASSEQNKLGLLKQLIDAAEESIASAKEILNELNGELPIKANGYTSKKPTNGLNGNGNDSDKGKIIEGVFDGQNMIGPDGKKYPVPPNYASKSKLVSGDILKLTVTETGSFIYKQIGPVERIQVIGTLKQVGSEFIVNTDNGDYQVLTASVTYFKAEPGDQVTLIIAAGSKAGWGAIENIIPRNVAKAAEANAAAPASPDESAKEPETFEIPKTLFKRTE